MDAAGGGRLELVAADGAVDQAADLLRVDCSSFDGVAAAHDALVAGLHSPRPEAPLADAAHQFQAAFGELQALIQGREAAFDVVAGDDFFGNRVAKRFEADVAI